MLTKGRGKLTLTLASGLHHHSSVRHGYLKPLLLTLASFELPSYPQSPNHLVPALHGAHLFHFTI